MIRRSSPVSLAAVCAAGADRDDRIVKNGLHRKTPEGRAVPLCRARNCTHGPPEPPGPRAP
eukprot:753161-Hanusia_phi.AAC.1